MVSRWPALVLFACLACACGDDAQSPATGPEAAGRGRPVPEQPAPRPRTPPQAPTKAPSLALAGAPQCHVDPPFILAESIEGVTSIAVEIPPSSPRGLVLVASRAGRLDVFPIDALGHGGADPAGSVEIPAAPHLLSLDPLGARTLVVTTHDRCAPDSADHCIFARALGAGGAARTPVLSFPTGPPIRALKKATTPDALFLLRSHPHVPPIVDRIALGASGELEHTAHPLVPPPPPVPLEGDPMPYEALALAADANTGRFAALVRHGFVEDEAGEILLIVPPRPPVPVEALHHALAIDSFSWLEGSAAAVASFETSRPTHVLIGPDGEPLERPTVLSPRAPLPPPFADRLGAALGNDGENQVLRRRNGAGDPVGRPTEIGPARADEPADLAWTGTAFLVARARQGRIETVRVSCGAPP